MLSAIVAAGTAADQGAEPPAGARPAAERAPADGAGFRVEVERFADVRILRYRVPGFEALAARTKELLYYLYEAALCGRDIIYDQKYRYNLAVKRTLEQIVRHYPGDRDTADFRALTLYLEARLVRERHSSPLRARQARARLLARRVRGVRARKRRRSFRCAKVSRSTSSSRSSRA